MKASVILAAACFLSWLLRRHSAAERHAVWAAAFASAAVLPILTSLLPSWQPHLAQRIASAFPVISAPATGSGLPPDSQVMFQAESIETSLFAGIWPLLWFAGAAAALVVFATGLVRQNWLLRRSVAVADPVLLRIASEAARDLGCHRRIQLRRSLTQTMPMTWGVCRPRILLPDCMDEWPEDRKRVVIAHEVAHVQRLDRLFHALAQILCSVYWFNPLYWVACNRLYRESEQACDDAVINLGIDARNYAAHLLAIARGLTHSSFWSGALAMARPSTLERRFASLLQAQLQRNAVTSRAVFGIAITTLCLVLPLAAVHISNPSVLTSQPDLALPTIDQYTIPPLYSDEARARGIEGFVTVEVRVGVEGTVERLQVVKKLGYGLDENALVAVRDWRFFPARRNGVAIEATTQIDVEFNLRNAEINEEIANDMAMRIGPGVSPPQVVRRIEPVYPPAATRPKPMGAVILDAVILEDGTPKIVRIIRSLNWELDEIAINALKQWRFSPAMKDGNPIKVRMNIAVGF
jgi:TonB family protein